MGFKQIISVALLAGLIGIRVPGPANADDTMFEAFELRTAGDLRLLCTRKRSEPHFAEARSFCLGFIEGGAQFHDAITQMDTVKQMVCRDNTVTLDQVADTFVAFVEANPQYMNDGAMDTLVRAASQKWPCAE